MTPTLMPPIYLTALLTAALAILVYGAVIFFLREPVRGRALLLAFLIALPLQPLAYYLVRVPLDRALISLLGPQSPLYFALVTLYAPLTEEPAKLIPLLVPLIYRDIKPENFVRYALAIGLGFGLGEMAFVANSVARNPAYAGIPFWQFTGFINERFMVCLLHAAFVSVSLWRLRRRLVLGLLGAMVLHYFGNFPIFLMNRNVFELGRTLWTVIVSVWIQMYFLAGILLLALFATLALLRQARRSPANQAEGRVTCPDCGATYERSSLSLTLGRLRFERCPRCHKWHSIVPVGFAQGPP